MTTNSYPATEARGLQDDPVRLFDMAAKKHKRELEDMYWDRGGFGVSLYDMSSESLARVLKPRAARPREESEREILYPEGTGLLFYSYAEDHLHTWLLDRDGIQAYDTQAITKPELSDAIADLRAAFNVDSLQRSALPQLRRDVRMASSPRARTESRQFALGNLGSILLPPAIATKLGTLRHLIVVPILEIGTVPFAVLQPFGDGSCLVDRMSLSIAPSLFDLGVPLFPPHPYGDHPDLTFSPLVAGNPYLPEGSDWIVPPLPGAEEEAKAVAAMMHAQPLIGKEATKERIVSQAPKASFLYFATHGTASSLDPLSGGFLMLSGNSFEGGWWTAEDIQKASLWAHLAVLSACQTGLGQAHDAGIIGLSRAFQIAGVPRVVMSLWKVDDQATKDLMQAFVKRLTTTMPSEALRLAMLETRAEHPDPARWASFVLFGTPR